MDNQTSASINLLYPPEQILFQQLTLIKDQLYKLLNQINQYNLNIRATSLHGGLLHTPEAYITQLKQLCVDNLSQFLGSADKSSFFQAVYNALEHYQNQEFPLQKQASRLNAVYQLHRAAFEQFSSTPQQIQASSFHILQMQKEYVSMPKQTIRLSPSYFENTPGKDNSTQFVESSSINCIAEPSRYVEKPPQHSDEIYQAVIGALSRLIQKTTQGSSKMASQFGGVHDWDALRLHNEAFKSVIANIRASIISFEYSFQEQCKELINYLDSLHKQTVQRTIIQENYEKKLRCYSDGLEQHVQSQHEKTPLFFKAPVIIDLTQQDYERQLRQDYEERLRYVQHDLQQRINHYGVSKVDITHNNQKKPLFFQEEVIIDPTQKGKYPEKITIASLLS